MENRLKTVDNQVISALRISILWFLFVTLFYYRCYICIACMGHILLWRRRNVGGYGVLAIAWAVDFELVVVLLLVGYSLSFCLLRRMCQKLKQHAPKGQKPIAQGNTLGKSITNTNAPCKGKSVNYQCFCPCRAFCCFQSVHPRRCLGLCAFGAFSPLCLTFDTSSSYY